MYNNLSETQHIATNADENNLDRHTIDIKFQERLQYLISSFELELTTDQQRAITKLWQFIHSSPFFPEPELPINLPIHNFANDELFA